MGEFSHIPVMPERVASLLDIHQDDVVVDGTVGLGGHSFLMGSRLGRGGTLICFDRDAEAIAYARTRLAGLACRKIFINQPFDRLDAELIRHGIAKADKILLDIGVSSLQLDKAERGFSFMHDGPLDMRMNQASGRTAMDIVNTWPEDQLIHLFTTLGEERFSRRIAKSIVENRSQKPIQSTGELSSLVASAVPFRGRTHPATKIFQALRMEVNDELGQLSRGLAAAGRILNQHGRLAVITFHSLEDRLVKKTMARWNQLGLVTVVTRVEAPSREEARSNRRARSAKLRVVERT